MEDCNVFLGLALRLRSSNFIEPVRLEHLHSSLSRSLRKQLLDSEYDLQLGLAYMTAMGGLYSHPDMDGKKIAGKVRNIYSQVQGFIPYKKTEGDAVDSDMAARYELLAKFKKMFKPKSEQKKKVVFVKSIKKN